MMSKSFAGHETDVYSFASCEPASETIQQGTKNQLSPRFCAKWNPDFPFVKQDCCAGHFSSNGKKNRHKKISRKKLRGNYCADMTPEQKEYKEMIGSGSTQNVLELIQQNKQLEQEQAFCSENNGFLAYGRPLVPTSENRIKINAPHLCLNFGTDPMIGMIETLGRWVGKKYSEETYSGVHLIIGDISAPKGGRIYGRTGGKRHLSHTSGQDVDIGFLSIKAGQESPSRFSREFNTKENWALIQEIFQNPHACVKVMFLDRSHIRKLSKVADADSNWKLYKRFIRHMPGHKNHLHVRIGKAPGDPGCSSPNRPEFEFEMEESVSYPG
jgi:murein endopeptidase